MKQRPTRGTEELRRGAEEVCLEWTKAAELTAVAETFQGARSVAQSAVITAAVVHYRCLVNFVSGGYTGKRFDDDIWPSDFLGHEWHTSDDALDRTMRARLAVLNTEQQHISWRRLEEKMTLWPIGFLVREVGIALSEFTNTLGILGGPGTSEFERARLTVSQLLAPRTFDRMTVVDLARPR